MQKTSLASLAVVFSVLLISCGTSPPDQTYQRKIPQPYRVGEIALYNEPGGFVLLKMDPGYAPEPGRELHSVVDGRVQSVVRVTPQKKRPYFIADVVKGEPTAGATVFHYPKKGTEPDVGRGG